MKLGVFLMSAGHHAGAWRHPAAHVGNRCEDFLKIAKSAAAANLDMLFCADTLRARLGDMQTASRSPVRHATQAVERRGRFRTEHQGTTLRDHLGLPRPSIQPSRS
jgi:hypothetical protein